MFTLSSKRLDRLQNRIITFQSKRRVGDYAKLAARTGYDRSHVRRVLIGERSPNILIVDQATQMVVNR